MRQILIILLLITGLMIAKVSLADSPEVPSMSRDGHVLLIIDRWRNTDPTRSGARWEALLSQTLNQLDNQQLQYAYDAKTYERLVKIASAPQIDGIQSVSTNAMH